MSNHASRAITRKFAWHFKDFTRVMRELGNQARIEQRQRYVDRMEARRARAAS